MWKIAGKIRGMAVYCNQRFSINGWKIEIHDLNGEQVEMMTGVIGAHTKISFRTKSTRMIWLV